MMLATGKRFAGGPRKHVHLQAGGMTVSSDVPVECIHECDVLDVRLPGELGCYVYPSDAVLHVSNENALTFMVRYRKETTTKQRQMVEAEQYNHLTVAKRESQARGEEEEEEEEDGEDGEDEDEEDEDNDDEDHEEEEEEAQPPLEEGEQWSDDEAPPISA